MWKSLLISFSLISLLAACNFSDKPGDPKEAPIPGEVKSKSTMFAYNHFDENIVGVYLVGTHNDWDQTADPFDYNKETNNWELDLDMDTGIYYYKFLIKRRGRIDSWELDPNNPVALKDEGGYTNSAVYINPLGRIAKFKKAANQLFSIRIDDEKVSEVYLTGDFREWSFKKDEEYQLQLNTVTGEWEIELDFEPGTYMIKYYSFKKNTNKVYDRYADPRSESQDVISDGYGGFNSRVVITPWEMAPISEAEAYYCNDDASITSVSMRILDTLTEEMPKELYSYYMRYNPENGCWERESLNLRAGRYEYKFVVKTSRGDEQWIHDPKSNTYEMVEDKFEEGSFNSLITIGRAMPEVFEFSFDTSRMEDIVAVYLVGDFNEWDNTEDLMNYDGVTKTWTLSKRLTRGKYGYKFRFERADEASYEEPLFLNDPKSMEARESDDYGYHSVLTVY